MYYYIYIIVVVIIVVVIVFIVSSIGPSISVQNSVLSLMQVVLYSLVFVRTFQHITVGMIVVCVNKLYQLGTIQYIIIIA